MAAPATTPSTATTVPTNLGGAGNDTLRTGAGNDVIVFNRGDGRDTFVASDSGQGVLSLGGGIAYSDGSSPSQQAQLCCNYRFLLKK